MGKQNIAEVQEHGKCYNDVREIIDSSAASPSEAFITQLSIRIINTLKPRQNGRHFAEDIFKCIFLNENVWIPIQISLKFVPQGPINNIPALVQVMAWRRPGDKPLSGPMMVRLPTNICVTRPQGVNSPWSCDDTCRHGTCPWLVQVMVGTNQGPFYKHGLTLIPAWISNHMPCKVGDEITYPSQTSAMQPLKFRNG